MLLYAQSQQCCLFKVYAFCAHFMFMPGATSISLLQDLLFYTEVSYCLITFALENLIRDKDIDVIIILLSSWFLYFSVWRLGLNRKHIRTTFARYINYGTSNHIQLCFYVLSVRYVQGCLQSDYISLHMEIMKLIYFNY